MGFDKTNRDMALRNQTRASISAAFKKAARAQGYVFDRTNRHPKNGDTLYFRQEQTGHVVAVPLQPDGALRRKSVSKEALALYMMACANGK